ncbi:hypothetical protein HanXRQr2_Chr16g0725491 [Helianthus annuus]|uniref:Uncharacterized protein n=1 Tax=Helianthus annuus TaxID=4232 RepID=A0A251RZY4_HELAN|nr:hypothetical protein HanXRQr2_Chr16g0725491 [Helianthus annuus]
MFAQLPFRNQLLFHRSSGTQPPFPRISISIHHHPLNLRHNTMITSGHYSGSHLRYT